jgi:ubiquinone/menaquinone biosynthesis C-methylase UbiE
VTVLPLKYFTDQEYQKAFFEFGGFRERIAEAIGELCSNKDYAIVDLLSGHGLLSAAMARHFPQARIIGTGLSSDVESNQRVKQSGNYSTDLWKRFDYINCNVTRFPIKSSSIDLIVNFLGLEDVLMTSGRKGLRLLFKELHRMTRPEAIVQITWVEYGTAPEEKLAKQVWDSIGLNAVFLSRNEYLALLEGQSFQLQKELLLEMNKKMTAKQAREELEFACNDTPKTFSQFGVRAVKFDDLWSKFGSQIEATGMAYWNKIRVSILAKE